MQYATRRAAFRPTLEALFKTLEGEPGQFPKKLGKLAACRAAPVRYNKTAVWRCVFTIDEDAHVVRIVALGPHDEAYRDAERRAR